MMWPPREPGNDVLAGLFDGIPETHSIAGTISAYDNPLAEELLGHIPQYGGWTGI
jgi:hypothetical protein